MIGEQVARFSQIHDGISTLINHKADLINQMPLVKNVPIPALRSMPIAIENLLPKAKLQQTFKLDRLSQAFSLEENDLLDMLKTVMPLLQLLHGNDGEIDGIRLQALTEAKLINTLLSLPDEFLDNVVDIASKLIDRTSEVRSGFKELAMLEANRVVELIHKLQDTFVSTFRDVIAEAGLVPDHLMNGLFELVYLVENVLNLENVMSELNIVDALKLSRRDILKVFAAVERMPEVAIEDEALVDTGFLAKGQEQPRKSLGGTKLIANTTGSIASMLESLSSVLVSAVEAKIDLGLNSADLTFMLAEMIVNDMVAGSVLDAKEAAIRLIGVFGDELTELSEGAIDQTVSILGDRAPTNVTRKIIGDMMLVYTEWVDLLGFQLMPFKEYITGLFDDGMTQTLNYTL